MAKLKMIVKEQIEKILEQGRNEDEKKFLRKIANNSGIQGVNVI